MFQLILSGKPGFASFITGLVTWSFWKFPFFWVSHLMFKWEPNYVWDSRFPQGVKRRKHERPRGSWELVFDLSKLLTDKEKAQAKKQAHLMDGSQYDAFGWIPGYMLNTDRLDAKDKYVCFEFGLMCLPMLTDKKPTRAVGRHIIRGIRRLAKSRGVDVSTILTVKEY